LNMPLINLPLQDENDLLRLRDGDDVSLVGPSSHPPPFAHYLQYIHMGRFTSKSTKQDK